MKKIATILMLVVALLVGGMTADAKTTKKSTSSSKGLTFTTFVKMEKWSGYPAKVATYRKYTQIEASLKSMGYNCVNRRVESGIEDADGSYYECLIANYKKGNTSINFDGGRITIKFGSSSEKKAFINSVKAQGYRYSSYVGGYGYVGDSPELFISVQENGNTVIINGGAE